MQSGRHTSVGKRFQFLGIPPKGELGFHQEAGHMGTTESFQFLGIPPKGELGIGTSCVKRG